MYIAHSTFDVPPHKADEVIAIYRNRSKTVDEAPGFIRFLLLQNEQKPGELTVHMEWANKSDYMAWITGEQYKRIQALERQYPDPELAGVIPSFSKYKVVAQ
ncbi:antibiotic biosynthesis monooxygenase family protein [Paenibacillus methanolicus]|uniref:Heme-degrading monooxygenase HmoA n=1 Tax=Paenibacillus methanolicus TaxID=582686 RepID=A0A5S5CMU9_9BACL|nr:antibiotic biosynthesis monooxygenase family protein [Paenibacillus methanolicus]TYP79698.1 heme-degrading monooxygenase HmoA [Paenibacillus methanolicus]